MVKVSWDCSHDFQRRFYPDGWITSVSPRDHAINLAPSYKPGLFPGMGLIPTRAGIETGIDTGRNTLAALLALAKALIRQLES